MRMDDFEKYIDAVLQMVKSVAMEEATRSTCMKVTIDFSPTGAKISYNIDRMDYVFDKRRKED